MRKNISSGYASEDEYGYSRAVRVGSHVFVSGTTARGEVLKKDAYTQACSIIKIIDAALRGAGATLDDVVRTVTYVTDMENEPAAARAHREAFHAVRPASTVVEVQKLSPNEALVEIQVDAVISETL